MKRNIRWFSVMIGILLIFSAIGCNKEKKTANLKVTEQELVLRQDSPNSFVLDARGRVKNMGETDVKRLVITGYCRSCQEIFVNGQWFVSEVEKTEDQKDVISYLTPGNEEEFKFTGVAFYFTQRGEKPEVLPEDVEIVIDSYEVVE